MPETELLDALAAFLSGPAGLLPAPALIGATEPSVATELPAVVLSLDAVRRLGAGLGERSMLVSGSALPWQAAIDLANPVLPDEPTFRLLSADRLTLILPHGGLKRADGSDGALGPADLSVRLGATVYAVVAGAPAGQQVSADPAVGVLLFGEALPPAGTLQVRYVLGQWERRVTPIAGTLRIDVYGADAAAALALSNAVLRALAGAAAPRIPGLRSLALTQAGPVVGTDAAHASARRRSALLAFDHEHELNLPESSGGVIRRVPITTVIEAARGDGDRVLIEAFVDRPTAVP